MAGKRNMVSMLEEGRKKFSTWKFQIQIILKAEGLHKVTGNDVDEG